MTTDMGNSEADQQDVAISHKVDRQGISLDEDSSSFNIARSKQLIQTLEQTAQASAAILKRARAFHETHQMLDISKKMNANSLAQVRLSRQRKNDKSW